jgi:hypothetical protein
MFMMLRTNPAGSQITVVAMILRRFPVFVPAYKHRVFSNSPFKINTDYSNERGRDYHKKSKRPKKFFKGKPLFSLYFFDLFDLVVKNSSF